MFGGYFAGLMLATGLIVVGIQVWYISSLKTDGEIGGLRFVILLLISVLSILFLITPLIGVKVIPGFLVFVSLFFPILSLKISQYWETKHDEKIEAAETHEEIGKWESTIQKDPEHTGAYVRIGELYSKLGERDKALAYYKKALSLRPGDPKILDQILFVEKKMELMPKLTKSDLDIVKIEFKKFPLFVGLVLGVLFLIYLLSFLPWYVLVVVVVLVPTVFFFRWLMKQ